MLARIVQNLANSESTAPKVPAPQEDVQLPNSFMFYEDTDDNGHFIVDKQLELLVDDVVEPRDIDMLFVVIPPFTEAFYNQSGTDWTTEYGSADLFLPERVPAKPQHRTAFLSWAWRIYAGKQSIVSEIQVGSLKTVQATSLLKGTNFLPRRYTNVFTRNVRFRHTVAT